MNPDAFKKISQNRILNGPLGSKDDIGNNGAFEIPFGSFYFFIICSDQGGWDHVSISLKNRTPSWREMCYFKDLFWDEEETVIQFHPPKSEYINNHPNCLHLWKNQQNTIELPPSIFIGLK